MGKFVLGMLLGLASFAFAQTGGDVNPLCAMVQALDANWGLITWLVVGILGVMVLGVGAVYLTQGKAAYSLVVVIGGTIILIATYRLMAAAGSQLNTLSASSCGTQGTQITRPGR